MDKAKTDLLPSALRKRLPGYQEHTPKNWDPFVWIHYTAKGQEWYVIEGEADGTNDYLFYGILSESPAVLALFSLGDLVQRKAQLDTKFRPVAFSKLAVKKKWGDLKP